MTALITLTAAGLDTGPFNLYSNLDGYLAAFETGITKGALLAGYTSTLVPDYTETVRVKSTGACITQVDIPLVYPTTTTTTTVAPTTTTTTTAAPTTTTTTTSPTVDILLGVDFSSDVTACANIVTPVTKYIPNSQVWVTATLLWNDAAGTIASSPGYYSDGAKWYYWDGTSFTSSGFC